jgi:DNA-binding transcriptional LysR family regulator
MIGAARLDSDLLRTFLAVAESGSVSRGADRIARSQSAASLQIKRLENLVGRPLFARHGRGVALTTAGESLRPVAQQVVGLLDGALADLAGDRVTGPLRIGIPEEYGQTVLPHALAAFARDFPGVELTVQCAMSSGFSASLEQDRLDIAIFDVAAPEPGQHVLRRTRTCWAASRHHLTHRASPLPLALYDSECWWRDLAIDTLRWMGKAFRVAYTSESAAGIVAAIESGVAVGLVYEDAIGAGLLELTQADGFPAMPDTVLVAASRPGADKAAVSAMTAALRTAFATPS